MTNIMQAANEYLELCKDFSRRIALIDTISGDARVGTKLCIPRDITDEELEALDFVDGVTCKDGKRHIVVRLDDRMGWPDRIRTEKDGWLIGQGGGSYGNEDGASYAKSDLRQLPVDDIEFLFPSPESAVVEALTMFRSWIIHLDVTGLSTEEQEDEYDD